jgi:hypothetical protein
MEPVQSRSRHNSRIFALPELPEDTFLSKLSFLVSLGATASFFVAFSVAGVATAVADVVVVSSFVFGTLAIAFLAGLVAVLGVVVEVFFVI